ncbi:MAG: hypothetical protein ABIH63_01250 [archaeon]
MMKAKLFLALLFSVLLALSVSAGVATSDNAYYVDYDDDYRGSERPRLVYTYDDRWDDDDCDDDDYDCYRRAHYYPYDDYCDGRYCYTYYYDYGRAGRYYTRDYRGYTYSRTTRCYTYYGGRCYDSYYYDRDFNRFYYWFKDGVDSTYHYVPSRNYPEYRYGWDGISTY